MPYIPVGDRSDVERGNITNAGELNYFLTETIHRYVQRQGLRYGTLAEVVGVLETMKAEFLRAVVAPYEDIKIVENGRVSRLDTEFGLNRKFQQQRDLRTLEEYKRTGSIQ